MAGSFHLAATAKEFALPRDKSRGTPSCKKPSTRQELGKKTLELGKINIKIYG